MYKNYAESKRWKTEFIDVNENGIGGFKEVSFMINGQGAYSRLKSRVEFTVYSVSLQQSPADVSILLQSQ